MCRCRRVRLNNCGLTNCLRQSGTGVKSQFASLLQPEQSEEKMSSLWEMEKKRKKVILTRHCACDPASKMPTEQGIQASNQLGEKYKDEERVTLVVSGSEPRCQITAQHFVQGMGLPLEVVRDTRLDPANAKEKAAFRKLPEVYEEALAAIRRDGSLFFDIPLRSEEGVKFILEKVGRRVLDVVHQAEMIIGCGGTAVCFSHSPMIEYAMIAKIIEEGGRPEEIRERLRQLPELESAIFGFRGRMVRGEMLHIRHTLIDGDGGAPFWGGMIGPYPGG